MEKVLKVFTKSAMESIKSSRPLDVIANRMSFPCTVTTADGTVTDGVKVVTMGDLFTQDQMKVWKDIRNDLRDRINAVDRAARFFGVELNELQARWAYEALMSQFKIISGAGMDTAAMTALVTDGAIAKVVQKAAANALQFTIWKSAAEYKAAHAPKQDKPSGRRVIDWSKRKETKKVEG